MYPIGGIVSGLMEKLRDAVLGHNLKKTQVFCSVTFTFSSTEMEFLNDIFSQGF
jgi:hypothetical protein